MSDSKRIMGKYSWLPIEQRPTRIPGARPYRKPELRKPLYLLIYDEPEIYFVNLSQKLLNNVSAVNHWNVFVDGDVGYLKTEGPDYCYESVTHYESVKVGRYHRDHDCDYSLDLDVTVSLANQECRTFSVIYREGLKRSIPQEKILLWDNGDLGKFVREQ